MLSVLSFTHKEAQKVSFKFLDVKMRTRMNGKLKKKTIRIKLDGKSFNTKFTFHTHNFLQNLAS